MSAQHQPLPKKLHDALEENKFYKFDSAASSSGSNNKIIKVFNDQKERAILEEFLGQAKNYLNTGLNESKTPINSQFTYAQNINSLEEKVFKPSSPMPQKSASSKLNLESQHDYHPVRPKSPFRGKSTPVFDSAMLKRLNESEKELKDMRKLLAIKLLENEELSENLEFIKSAQDGPSNVLKDLRREREKNVILQKKIEEMEKFLLDYGLIWVGNEEKTFENQVEFEDFRKKIEELNTLIHSEPTQIVFTAGSHPKQRQAKLARVSTLLETMKLTYYKNGLMINRGPFRLNQSDSYVSFMKDIFDGYFPSEFKTQYPNGVLFDVVDRQHEDFSDHSDQTLSMNAFLTNLPKTVIRKGEVIHLREDIASKCASESPSKPVNGSRPSRLLNELPVTKEESDLSMIDMEENIGSPSGVSGGTDREHSGQVRVKIQNGEVVRTQNIIHVDLTVGPSTQRTDDLEAWTLLQVKLACRSCEEKEGSMLFRGGHYQLVDYHPSSSEGGQLVLVFKLLMRSSDTIQSVKEELTGYLFPSKKPESKPHFSRRHVSAETAETLFRSSFDLKSSYPRRIVEDWQTLAEGELCPNGTLWAVLKDSDDAQHG